MIPNSLKRCDVDEEIKSYKDWQEVNVQTPRKDYNNMADI